MKYETNTMARLYELNEKVRSKTATRLEQNELMKLLYESNSITETQYNNYLKGRNADDILSTALTIAGIVLLGYLLSKAFSK